MTTTLPTTKELEKGSYEALKAAFAYTNKLQAPHLIKVVISTGTGKIKDKKKIDVIEDRLAKITGQKAAPRGAKKSIASFKVRQGDVVGYQVTLRGSRMYDFLDKLIHISLPRTRDFRGLDAKAIDSLGNMTIGIKEHTIFPETADEDLKDVFGLAITIVTTAKNKKEAEAFFRHIGVPLK
ncbi:50S ribosomal protein L5 [Candidatus Kaiserbacteria bacterium RIFCSPHIGHO2_01_FULL_48_10]|uniref:Large ribosomal subunit protein uL5 n=1 Tax=Candidatus Kaiserbacteria bacterium RIFCSPHIGHO2_01_FULL_48_10 TaxID=1798476 RepID=A0A1F6C5K7_9BACT|nr:MAG: 50S ribosomal protein L5 [Candidatus Kaiserbacteria bacterium RIFCSPHIGHO2_01_FULL_48_10]